MGACDIHLRAVAQHVANQNSNVFAGRAIVNDSEIVMRRLPVLFQPFVRYCLFSLALVLSSLAAPLSLGQEERPTEILSELIKIEQKVLGGKMIVRCGNTTFRIEKPTFGSLVIKEPNNRGGWSDASYLERIGHTFILSETRSPVSISDLGNYWPKEKEEWAGHFLHQHFREIYENRPDLRVWNSNANLGYYHETVVKLVSDGDLKLEGQVLTREILDATRAEIYRQIRYKNPNLGDAESGINTRTLRSLTFDEIWQLNAKLRYTTGESEYISGRILLNGSNRRGPIGCVLI